MKALITIGCKTDHGGIIVEADSSFLIEGKAVHLEGMKHVCPKCKKTVTAISSGRGFMVVGSKTIIMAGDKASCGAIFLPQQSLVVRTNGTGIASSSLTNGIVNSALSDLFDEQIIADFEFAEGLPYFIETKSGKTFQGKIGADGKLPRISTENSETYSLFLGEEAIVKGSENDG